MFGNFTGRSGAKGYVMTDATGTPITSPVASGTSDVTLVAPATACGVAIHVAQADAMVKIGSTTALLPNGTYFYLPCRNGDSIVVDRTTATAVQFIFFTLD